MMHKKEKLILILYSLVSFVPYISLALGMLWVDSLEDQEKIHAYMAFAAYIISSILNLVFGVSGMMYETTNKKYYRSIKILVILGSIIPLFGIMILYTLIK